MSTMKQLDMSIIELSQVGYVFHTKSDLKITK